MKKSTLSVLMFIVTVFLASTTMAQVAVTISPADATYEDEITLTLDATLSCPAEGLFNAGEVRIHSGVTLGEDAWQNVVEFDGMGADGTSPELMPVTGMLPAAISMTPRYATWEDTIMITLDIRKACPAGGLYEADSVMMHSGVTIDDNAWQNVVDFDGMGANGQMPKLMDNGDSTYSIEIVPKDFYGIEAGEVTAINCVFNGGTWDMEAKDFDEDGTTCIDFVIPLATEKTHIWEITFTPAAYYGLETGLNVPFINCVFNAGDWELGEAKDFDEDGTTCIDFQIPLGGTNIYESEAASFRLYPNPVDNALNIDNLNDVEKIVIYNLVGEKVVEVENVTSGSVKISTEEMNAGMYLISVYGKGTVQSTKFMKK